MKRIALLCLALATHVQAETLTGRVVGVADGDTLTVLDARGDSTKIRLHQIDAPEKKQDYGQRSKQSLSDLTYGKLVRVEVFGADKYARTIGKVWVNGQDANLEQVKRGMAWVYTQYAKDPAYYAAERVARNGRVGLWNQPNPMPPWQYRHPGQQPKSVGTTPHDTSNNSPPRCGEKRFCKEMHDCSEARFFFNNCGIKQLDGDGDGQPCEALCRPR